MTFSTQRPVRENNINLRMTAEQVEILDTAAARAEVSRSELLRMALDLWLTQHPITPEQPKPPKKSSRKK